MSNTKTVTKLILKNYKRFRGFAAEFDPELNLLIGDNEAGKSTILSAIDLVLSGSRMKVEGFGLDSLINTDAVNGFFEAGKHYEDLPIMEIELYLSELNNPDYYGRINSTDSNCDGLRLTCKPDDAFGDQVKEVLAQEGDNFPFEFYEIIFYTFQGGRYNRYKRPIRHLTLDSTQINNERATRSYINTLYDSMISSPAEKSTHKNEYRLHKGNYTKDALTELNQRVRSRGYEFVLKTGPKSNLETDLTIAEGGIPIEHKGKGRQCFVKTEFALEGAEHKLDVILIEEPENHLSHTHVNKLIDRIRSSQNKQLFIATHSDHICARLDLRKAILLNSNSEEKLLLKDLDETTANFFMKAPDNNILEFILSPKVLLVEGDAEFILMEAFFDITLRGKPDEIHIISVGGTSFKRYLALAKMLGIKTAVITDNDSDYQKNCVERYQDYANDSDIIQVFSEQDNTRQTFEVSVYQENTKVCDDLFHSDNRSLPIQEYMLKNKASVSLALLKHREKLIQASTDLICPQYIQNAIQWLNA